MIEPHKTAIKRHKMSAPTQWLKENNLLIGRILDYGCGHGKDCEILGCDGYDPYFQPEFPTGQYETIICNYVLNVIPEARQREYVIWTVNGLLSKYGIAYFTVRTDEENLNGLTKKNTWQGLITLDLPVIKKGFGFKIYQMRRKP